jgi:hypothetical protein
VRPRVADVSPKKKRERKEIDETTKEKGAVPYGTDVCNVLEYVKKGRRDFGSIL